MRILVNLHSSEEVARTFYTEKVYNKLETLGDVEYGIFNDRDILREKLRGVDVLFCGWGMKVADDDLLSKADKLRLICYTGGSVADFMREDTVRHGITVCSGNKFYANSVAEGTIGYILLAQRRLPKIINLTAEQGWAPQIYTDGIRFKTIGIIGFGMIAKYLAKMLQAFECRVKICSEWFTEEMQKEYRAEKCTMDEIFKTCDIVTLHESLREETYHMIDRHYFGMMKENALFVNTARGPIIVEEDLAETAKEGKIRAILDVYDKEPLPMDSSLRGLENVILVPHCGGPTTDLREYVTLALCDEVTRFFAGKPLEHEIPWSYAKNMTNHQTGKK